MNQGYSSSKKNYTSKTNLEDKIYSVDPTNLLSARYNNNLQEDNVMLKKNIKVLTNVLVKRENRFKTLEEMYNNIKNEKIKEEYNRLDTRSNRFGQSPSRHDSISMCPNIEV